MIFFFSLLVTLFLIPFDMVRFSVARVPVSLPEAAAFLAGVIFFLDRRRKFSFPRWVLLSWGMLLGGVLTSLLWGVWRVPEFLRDTSWQHGLGIIKAWFFMPFIFGVAIFQGAESLWRRKILILVFLASIVSLASISLLSAWFGEGMTYDGRLRGILSSPNFLAMALVPALPFFVSGLIRSFLRQERQQGVLYGTGFVLVLSALILTKSYGGWLAALVSLGVFLGLQYSHRFSYTPRTLAAIGGIFFLGILSILIGHSAIVEYFSPDSRSSFASRIIIWHTSLAILYDFPLFGIGPGNFQDAYLFYQQYFPPYLEWAVPEPHNIFLAFWLETGILGLGAFLWLIVRWFLVLLRAFFERRSEELVSVLASFSGLLSLGLVDTPYFRTNLVFWFWTLFFLGLAMQKKAHQTRRISQEKQRVKEI